MILWVEIGIGLSWAVCLVSVGSHHHQLYHRPGPLKFQDIALSVTTQTSVACYPLCYCFVLYLVAFAKNVCICSSGIYIELLYVVFSSLTVSHLASGHLLATSLGQPAEFQEWKESWTMCLLSPSRLAWACSNGSDRIPRGKVKIHKAFWTQCGSAHTCFCCFLFTKSS